MTEEADLDTVLYDMRLREASASFEMPFSPQLAKWTTELGLDKEITLTTGGIAVSKWVGVLRRILSFCYGWLGYRPPFTGTTVYRFKARINEVRRSVQGGHDVASVEMGDVRDLTVEVQ